MSPQMQFPKSPSSYMSELPLTPTYAKTSNDASSVMPTATAAKILSLPLHLDDENVIVLQVCNSKIDEASLSELAPYLKQQFTSISLNIDRDRSEVAAAVSHMLVNSTPTIPWERLGIVIKEIMACCMLKLFIFILF